MGRGWLVHREGDRESGTWCGEHHRHCRYKACYRGRDRRVHSKTWRTKADAWTWVTEQLGDPAKRGVDPARGRDSLGTYAELWLDRAEHTLRASTVAQYRWVYESFIKPTLGDQPLNTITRDDVLALFDRLQAKGTPAPTIHATYRFLRRLLNDAVDMGRITANPAVRLALSRGDEGERRFLTASELLAVANAAPDRYRALVLLLGWSGVRIGEASALRVGNVDVDAKEIVVVESAAEVGGHRIEGATKTGHSRKVHLPASVAAELGHHVEAYCPDDDPRALVFTTGQGQPVRQSNFRNRVFHPACIAAKIRNPQPRVHDLRHTAAALAIQTGAHPKAVQELLGHASVNITLDVYGHLFPAAHEDVAAGLDKAFRKAARGSRKGTA